MKFLYHIQGPVQFDENGVRKAIELRVLQYRTDYINGTPILSELNGSVSFNATSLEWKLGLIEVAHVNENKKDLEFPGNYSNNVIWPSKLWN
jgi:hypothetical protein